MKYRLYEAGDDNVAASEDKVARRINSGGEREIQ